MRIDNPADWIIDRLKSHTPFFSVRFNDGEMTMMYRTVPEGKVLGTDVNPAPTNYQLGDELRQMLHEIGGREDCLVGCSWGTDRADSLCELMELDLTAQKEVKSYNWCNEHWPLDGVVDGSTIRLLDQLRKGYSGLVTCGILTDAAPCLSKTSAALLVPKADSWKARDSIYEACIGDAQAGMTFVWAAGIGLKPTAWRLWEDYPLSSHIDVGHLFNGVFGLRDYGWLMRGDGPWHAKYFSEFVPYVKRFIS